MESASFGINATIEEVVMKSLAIFMSHPIQYQVPLLCKLAQSPYFKTHTYFFWNFGVEETYDVEFKTKIKWDIPILEGYEYSFLKNYSRKPSSSFWGQINPGAISAVFAKKHNAVLIFGWALFSNWLVIFAALLSRTPILLQAESPFNQEITKTGFKQNFKKIVLKQLFKRVSGFLYIGEQNRQFFKSYDVPDHKLFFAPYSVNNDRYFQEYEKKASSKAALRKKHGIADDVTVILFVGKLFEKKRPWTLLKAFEKLSYKNLLQKTVLVFVGDGEYKAEMMRYAKEKNLQVYFAGFKNQLELPDFYLLADLFVLPSGVGETWGLVVNEAMCFGLPVIVSDMVGCGTDLVRNNENGYTFKLDSVDELTEVLTLAMSETSKLKQFGKKSQEIIKNYTHDNDVQAIRKALEVHG